MPAKPSRFPIKFKVFLRLAFGGRLHGDRLHFFRKYWCWTRKLEADIKNLGLPPSEQNTKTDAQWMDMANEVIAKYTRDWVYERDFNELFNSIENWRWLNRLEQRQNAAKSSWTPKARRKRKRRKQQKSLGGGQNPRK